MSSCPFQILPQLKARLLHDIESGVYRPGEKLLSDRELCKVYHVGRSSMASVLKQLHEERYVERIPVKGTFVRQDLQYQSPSVQLVLVTANASFSPEAIGYFAWSAIMELIRGTFEQAAKISGVRMTLMHCTDTTNPALLRRYVEELAHFDGVIFCGHTLRELKAQFAQTGKPALVVFPKVKKYHELFPVVYEDIHRLLPKYLQLVAVHKKPVTFLYRRGDVADWDEDQNIRDEVISGLRHRHIQCQELFIDHEFHQDTALMELEKLTPQLKQLSGQVVIVFNRCMVEALRALLLQLNVEAEVFAFTAGVLFQPRLPALTFIKEQPANAGAAAVKALAQFILHQTPIKDVLIPQSICCGSKVLFS